MVDPISQQRKFTWARCIGFVGMVSLLVSTVVFSAPEAHAQRPADWSTYQYNNERTGFNKFENVITQSSVASLKPKWVIPAGGSVSTQPTTANGTMYWGSWDGYEHATSVANGSEQWEVNIGQTTNSNCYPPTVGAASTATIATKGRPSELTVFVGGGDSNFYALDAATGAILWKVALGDTSAGNFLWSSPAVFNGSVYVGMASFGDCPLVQGKLFQLNASDGTIQHVFNVVPDGCTGGGVWGSPAIDSSGRVYFATGNPGSCSAPTPYAEAVVELNAIDLSYVASWQVPASQAIGDGDFGSTPTIFNSMLGVVNKNGIYYAFQRNRIAAGPVWQTQVAVPPCLYCGYDSISSSAWDGSYLYVAGGSTTVNGVSCDGTLQALNPSNGAVIWQRCFNSGAIDGPVGAVPGLVIVGAGQNLVAVSSSSGQQLFAYTQPAGNWFVAPSVSNGAVYVGVMGAGGGYFGGQLYAFTPNGQ